PRPGAHVHVAATHRADEPLRAFFLAENDVRLLLAVGAQVAMVGRDGRAVREGGLGRHGVGFPVRADSWFALRTTCASACMLVVLTVSTRESSVSAPACSHV